MVRRYLDAREFAFVLIWAHCETHCDAPSTASLPCLSFKVAPCEILIVFVRRIVSAVAMEMRMLRLHVAIPQSTNCFPKIASASTYALNMLKLACNVHVAYSWRAVVAPHRVASSCRMQCACWERCGQRSFSYEPWHLRFSSFLRDLE